MSSLAQKDEMAMLSSPTQQQQQQPQHQNAKRKLSFQFEWPAAAAGEQEEDEDQKPDVSSLSSSVNANHHNNNNHNNSNHFINAQLCDYNPEALSASNLMYKLDPSLMSTLMEADQSPIVFSVPNRNYFSSTPLPSFATRPTNLVGISKIVPVCFPSETLTAVGGDDEEFDNASRKLRIIVRSLKCPVPQCGLVLNSKATFDEHLVMFHNVQAHRCLFAGCTFSSHNSYLLGRHIRDTHPNTSEWACGKCPCVYKRYGSLHRHIEDFHREGHFACPECDFHSGPNRKIVRNHMSTHRVRTKRPKPCKPKSTTSLPQQQQVVQSSDTTQILAIDSTAGDGNGNYQPPQQSKEQPETIFTSLIPNYDPNTEMDSLFHELTDGNN